MPRFMPTLLPWAVRTPGAVAVSPRWNPAATGYGPPVAPLRAGDHDRVWSSLPTGMTASAVATCLPWACPLGRHLAGRRRSRSSAAKPGEPPAVSCTRQAQQRGLEHGLGLPPSVLRQQHGRLGPRGMIAAA